MSDPQKHHRQSIRLKEYDYSQAGAYFITITTHRGKLVFGQIRDGELVLNEYGEIVQKEWRLSAEIRDEVEMDEFVVMPNLLHGIVFIKDNEANAVSANTTTRAHSRAPLHRRPKSVSSFVAQFKATTTKSINNARKTRGSSIWQRNYYEHVIRNEKQLKDIREYIANNPLKWELDRENPDAVPMKSREEWEF